MDQVSTAAERLLVPLTCTERSDLLWLARTTISAALRGVPPPVLRAPSEALLQPGAVFVSLHVETSLRGCVGAVVPEYPVHVAVARAARAAAFEDPRFPPLDAEELAAVSIEISRLGPLWQVAPEAVCPGRHGVSLRLGRQRAVFLPQVAARYGWEREELLQQLCEKALLSPDAWKHPAAQVMVFEAEVFGERESAITVS
jgi:AmmeMemoRadiSam system protein A